MSRNSLGSEISRESELIASLRLKVLPDGEG